MFTYCHGGVGHIALALSFLNVCLAPALESVDFLAADKVYFTLLGFFVVHFVAHFALTVLRDVAKANQVAPQSWEQGRKGARALLASLQYILRRLTIWSIRTTDTTVGSIYGNIDCNLASGRQAEG